MHIYAGIWFQGEPDFDYLQTTKDHLFILKYSCFETEIYWNKKKNK